MADILILGCGDVGTRLAQRYRAQGAEVMGLVRGVSGLERLERAGIPGRRIDLEHEELWPAAAAGARLFHLAPPPDAGRADPLTRRLAASFAAQAGQPSRVVYMSTTGVYGDCQGDWIDETHPVQPTADRSWRRWDAEQTLRSWSQSSGGALVVLRVAGIYGPDRLPLERLRAGVPMVRVEDSPYTNRIHVDDLVEVCMAAMARGRDGAVYNVSDGHPDRMTEYFLAVAHAAGLPPPPLIPLAEAEGRLSAGLRSYLAESRRLSDRRLREELGVALRYPTLRAGLDAILASAAGSPT